MTRAGRWCAAGSLATLALLIGGAAPPAGPVRGQCDVRRFGALGDGQHKDTAAIQAAIDACAGRGRVVLAGGTFVTAPLTLRSGTTLVIEHGATLAGSEDHDDYPMVPLMREQRRRPLLMSEGAQNVVIGGGGTIDGRGQGWWGIKGAGNERPRLIVFDHSQHVRIEGITIQNSAEWQVVPYYSDDLTFRNLRILAPDRVSHNTDGIDPFSSSHILIEHVLIDTGDDDVAIKSGLPGSPGPDAPSHDIVIRDCEFRHGHGLSIGSEVAGGVYNVTAERVHFIGTGTGVRIKSNRDRGNRLEHLVYRDLTMEDVATPILVSAFYPQIPVAIDPTPVTRLTPHFADIRIERLRATGAKQAAVIVGLPEAPIAGLALRDVTIAAQKGASVRYATVAAANLMITAAAGAPIDQGAGATIARAGEGK